MTLAMSIDVELRASFLASCKHRKSGLHCGWVRSMLAARRHMLGLRPAFLCLSVVVFQ